MDFREQRRPTLLSALLTLMGARAALKRPHSE
jgi:hypothetical protein